MAKNLTTAASSTNVAARKPRAKKPAAVMTVNHAEVIDADDDFSRLLAELGASPDMVIETAAQPANDQVVMEITEADLESAVGSAEAIDAMMSAATVEVIDADTAPSGGQIAGALPVEVEAAGETEDVAVASTQKGKKAKGKKAEADAAPGVEEPVTPEEAKAESSEPETALTKKVPTPRVHYSDKVARLQARMGDSLGEYMVLETADALLDDAELQVATAQSLAIIRSMNIKEKNRASNFIEFLSGSKAKLNHVLERVIALLERDGFVSTGNDGNLFKDLVARPYTPASARAMGGNTIGMFADLKVIVADGKGKFVPNVDSLLLMKAKSLLSVHVPAARAPETVEPELVDNTEEIDNLEALLAA